VELYRPNRSKQRPEIEGPVHIKTKQASKDVCISNSKKGSRQHRQYFKIRLVKNKRSHTSASSDSPNSESIAKVSRRKKNSYFDSALLERPSMVKLIKKPNLFDFTTVEIRKCVNKGEGYEKERPSIPTRIVKCLLIKKFILWFQNQGIRIFNPYKKGKGKYCGLGNLQTITLKELRMLKHPCFLLIQEMCYYRGISMIDAYFHGVSQTTLISNKL
jgi:hypothetical protein